MVTHIKRRIILVYLIHWFYALGFIILYWLSFWVDKMEKPFLFLAGATIASWIPYKDCPLIVWENKLRRKINLEARRFFSLTAFVRSCFKNFFGIVLPEYGTLYLIGAAVLIKILF